MFDIDKRDKRDKHGGTPLHHAILSNNPVTVELLLKEYNANPNVVDNMNKTTLLYWASRQDRNLSILRLLVKYGFDFARLVNQPDDQHAATVFHFLCCPDNTDHNIVCLKHLFSICQKIPNCSINILAQDHHGVCGLHCALQAKSIGMIKYLLENVYFPNNDKLNKDGIAFINMKTVGSTTSLWSFWLEVLTTKKDRNVIHDLKIFKLLLSYGMKVNSQDETDFKTPICTHYTEIVAFILNQNLCPIDSFNKIMDLMYKINAIRYGNVNPEILKILYNYGLKHGVIANKYHHSQIIAKAAQYNLTTFKTTISMILAKNGINDLKQYKQCDIISDMALKSIVQSPNIKPDVKSFVEALMCDDEIKLLKLDTDTPNDVVITCINNHKLHDSNNSKIINYKETCSTCGDSGDGSQSLSGRKCDQCKSFICNDCIIVQTICKKINDYSNYKSVLAAAENEILKYKNNEKLFNKVEWVKRFVLRMIA